jgi:tetratricopeptide (TPR) repeat protein
VELACCLAVLLCVFGSTNDEYLKLLTEDNDAMRACERLARSNTSLAQAALRARLRRVEAEYRQFVAANPRHASAMTAFGGLLYDTGRVDEALQWWWRAVSVDSSCAKAYNDLATHYGHEGGAAQALRLYDKAIQLEPANPMYRFNWATTCVLFRNDAKAVYGWTPQEIFRQSLEQFRQARNLAPNDPSFATAYAETFYMVPEADWHQAQAAWEFCLRQPITESTRQNVYAHLARVSIHLENFDQARAWLGRIDSDKLLSIRKALERKLPPLKASPRQ